MHQHLNENTCLKSSIEPEKSGYEQLYLHKCMETAKRKQRKKKSKVQSNYHAKESVVICDQRTCLQCFPYGRRTSEQNDLTKANYSHMQTLERRQTLRMME